MKLFAKHKQLNSQSVGETATTGVGSGTSQDPLDEDDKIDEDESSSKSTAFKDITMKEFEKLVIPKSVMQDGILFIWVEKEYVIEVCTFLENQQFYYVENMC